MHSAGKELTQAVKSAKKARRRKWCLSIFCIVLLGVLAAIIALYVVPKLKN